MKETKDIFICIASGPSLTEEQVKYIKGKGTVIAVNDNYRIAPWCDHVYAADIAWWKYHYDKVVETTNAKLWIAKRQPLPKLDKLCYIECVYNAGLGKGEQIHCGNNSGYQAINLAYYLGAKTIILIGYDMQVKGKFHWFGDHPEGLNNVNKYSSWVTNFDKLAKDLEEEGIQTYNCTIDSAIPYFIKKSIFELDLLT